LYMSGDKKYHFDEERTPNAIRGNMSTYKKLIDRFAKLQPFFLAENFIVKNCNPESKLTAFPFIKYEDAINEATSVVGDTSKEKTSGMYTSLEEKMSALNINKKNMEENKSKVASLQNPPKTNVVYQQAQNVATKPQEATFVVDKDMKPIETAQTSNPVVPKTPTPADIKM